MENCPLNGQPCPHTKCIHVTEVNSDYTAKSSKDMCVVCGVPYTTQDNKVPKSEEALVFDFINNLIKSVVTTNPQLTENVKACTSCGLTLYDIANTSRLGCGECYTCFKKELEPFILTFQHSLKHVGKVPKNKKKETVDIEIIKNQLKEAIVKEDYELASKLRDEIKKLE